MADGASSPKHTIHWRDEDKAALEFWAALPSAHERVSLEDFVRALSEVWEVGDSLTAQISRAVVSKADDEFVTLEGFHHFVHAFGPFVTGAKNGMLMRLLRDFFEGDQGNLFFRGNFHGHIGEPQSYALLHKPGDFLYRYSSRNFESICVVRFSSQKTDKGETVKLTEFLGNFRGYTWEQHHTGKEAMLYPTLQDYEAKHKEKLVTLVRAGRAGHYANSLVTMKAAAALEQAQQAAPPAATRAAPPVNRPTSLNVTSETPGGRRSPSPSPRAAGDVAVSSGHYAECLPVRGGPTTDSKMGGMYSHTLNKSGQK